MIAETMIHPETGEVLYRDIRPIEYTYKGESIIVDQPGWYPKNGNDDDGILSQEDMEVSDEAFTNHEGASPTKIEQHCRLKTIIPRRAVEGFLFSADD